MIAKSNEGEQVLPAGSGAGGAGFDECFGEVRVIDLDWFSRSVAY
jgi:hypothetical protein